MGRYLIFVLFWWSWALAPAAAQQLSPPPGYTDTAGFRKRPVYFHNDRLRLTLDPGVDTLVVRSDIARAEVKLSARGYRNYDETSRASYRRKCWLLFWQKKYRRVNRRQVNEQNLTVRNCDLGPFQRSGLHQFMMQYPVGATEIVNLFAYSGWTGRPFTGSVQPVLAADANRDALLKEAYCLLQYGLEHAKKDKLMAQWDTLLARQLAAHLRKGRFPHRVSNTYAQQEFALVFAPDNPLALFVADSSLNRSGSGKTEADSLRLFAGKFLKQALLTFGDTAFSTLKNEAGKAVALLPATAIGCLSDALANWIDLGFDKPLAAPSIMRIDDGGFVKEELLIEGVKSDVDASAFRVRTVQQYYRHVELIFRLRSPPAPD